MDVILICNIIFAVIMSTWYLLAYTKQIYRIIIKYGNVDSNSIKDLNTEQDRIVASTWFVALTGIVLTFGFLILYIIQSDPPKFPSCFETVIYSGATVPVVLFLMGCIIKMLYWFIEKSMGKRALNSIEMTTIVEFMAIIIDVILIVLDWPLGLYVAAVIIGKYVWIDFVFDMKTVVEKMAELIRKLKNSEGINIESFCCNYAAVFYPVFLGPTIINHFFLKNIANTMYKLSFLILMYISIRLIVK